MIMDLTITKRGKRTSRRDRRYPEDVWAEAVANHQRLVARSLVHRRFGYDSQAAVGFVVEKALPLPGRVLDVGTGKGRFVVALAQRVPDITTVDLSAEEQHFARLEATHAKVRSRVAFVVADAAELPWSAASFDAVVSMNAFHHFSDPCRVFSEMLRVLKPGGKMVVADFSLSGFRVMDKIHAAEGKTHPHPPSQFAQWRVELRQAGFSVRRFVRHHQEVLVVEPARPLAGPHSRRHIISPRNK
jgi:ubiquinone/menaquinone biosynthesis C-methylase UbiE